MYLSLGCIVMAAGNAQRFGENKLLYKYNNQTLIENTFSKIPSDYFENIVVVSQYDEIQEIANKYHYKFIRNNHPELGQSLSIKLGIKNINNCDAVLFMVSDQPLLKKESIIKLINEYSNNPGRIIGLSSNNRKGNPVIFPSSILKEFMTLEGDCGGKKIINNHLDIYNTIYVPEIELIDIDTKDDLIRISKMEV